MVDADRNQVHGGKTVYGARVGILTLETRYPRIPGDIGHATAWPFPVLYKVVRGATGERVTTARANDRSTELLDAFLTAGAELVQDGVEGITTSCGFLSIYQLELAAHCHVPVAASALMQIPFVERLLPPRKRVGVLTFSAALLGPDHLAAAGAASDTPVVGAVVLECTNMVPFARAPAEAADAGLRHLQLRHLVPRRLEPARLWPAW
jgi:hypothetical protein